MLFLTTRREGGEHWAQSRMRWQPSSVRVARLVRRFKQVGGLLGQLTAFFGGRGVILVYAEGYRAAR